MYIALDSQTILRLAKLRSFLLLGKAISFDLELLNIKDGKLYDLVKSVIDYRAIWFVNKPKDKDVLNLFSSFHKELEILLSELLYNHKFYLPQKKIYMPVNFCIRNGVRLKRTHEGIVLPNQLKFFGKKYFSLQYRFNRFNFELPFEIPESSTVLGKRFEFTNKLVTKGRKRYPFFSPIMPSLPIFYKL